MTFNPNQAPGDAPETPESGADNMFDFIPETTGGDVEVTPEMRAKIIANDEKIADLTEDINRKLSARGG